MENTRLAGVTQSLSGNEDLVTGYVLLLFSGMLKK